MSAPDRKDRFMRGIRFAFVTVILMATMTSVASAGNVSVEAMSKRHFKSGGVVHDKPVVTTTVSGALGTRGTYTGAYWTSDGNSSFDRDPADEIGAFIGHVHQFGNAKLDVGISYYNVVPFDKVWGTGDEVVVHTDLGYAIPIGKGTVTPFVRADLKHVAGLPSGAHLHAGARAGIPLSEHVSLRTESALLYNTGVYGTKRGMSGYTDAALSFKLTDRITLDAPKIRVTAPITRGDIRPEYSIGVAFNFRF